jgi:hypothetical protein
VKRLFVIISIIILLEWSTCFAALYLSQFGFSVDIPSHWKMTNSRILMENPEREKALDIVFKALSYPEEKKKEIIHALKNGQVEYWHYRGTASNATCRKVKGKGVLKSSEFKEFIGRFKKLYNVEVYDIGLKKIAGLDVFYYEWGGLVHGLRALQLNMQINQAEYLQFTLGTQDEKFETLKGEFWEIISTFKLL